MAQGRHQDTGPGACLPRGLGADHITHNVQRAMEKSDLRELGCNLMLLINDLLVEVEMAKGQEEGSLKRRQMEDRGLEPGRQGQGRHVREGAKEVTNAGLSDLLPRHFH